MFARIIPIQRLPKHLHVFDYTVPEDLHDHIAVGQLVSIPLRRSQAFGVVLSLEQTRPSGSTGELKPLLHIVHSTPIVSREHLHVWRILAHWYGVSAGTIAKMSLLPMQKRKLQTAAFTPLPERHKHSGETQYAQYRSAQERADTLQTRCAAQGQTLILVPTIHDIHDAVALFEGKHVCVWHSELSQKEQFSRWTEIRNGVADIIVGTRSAVLLPYYNLQSLIVDFEHDENHKHWDQAPRFHAKDVAALLSKVFGTLQHNVSFSPSVSSVHAGALSVSPPKTLPTIVDIASQRSSNAYATLSFPVEDTLHRLTGDAFFFLNRRGYSTSLSCDACGWVETCQACTLPRTYYQEEQILRCTYCHTVVAPRETCPTCHAQTLRLRGFGTELVFEQVRAIANKKLPHHLFCIDADSNERPDPRADTPHIIVGTEMAFPFIRWDNLSLVVFVDADRQLALPEYLATESLWHTVHEVLFRAPQARTNIQTRTPSHEVFASLAAPKQFYMQELARRAQLGYPPDTYLVRYVYSDKSQKQSKLVVEQTAQRLAAALTKDQKSATVSHPFALHPPFFRGVYSHGILVKIPTEDWMNTLIRFNRLFGPGWKIDPNPLSVLSP